MSSDEILAIHDEILAIREEVLANREGIPKSLRRFADLDAVYHGLRYFLLAATITFLVLAVLVAFNYRQSIRNAKIPEENRVLLCGAYEAMSIEFPEGCLP